VAAGVELFVSGQPLAGDNVDPKTLAPKVTVASEALVRRMTDQNDSDAPLSYCARTEVSLL
jgi:hypothetical protein